MQPPVRGVKDSCIRAVSRLAARGCSLSRALLSPPVAAFTAYHWIGIVFALWAGFLFVVGTMRPEFPGGAEKAVLGISVVLALGVIVAAITTSKNEKKEEAEAAPAKSEANPNPSPPAAKGGGDPAPPPPPPHAPARAKQEGREPAQAHGRPHRQPEVQHRRAVGQ